MNNKITRRQALIAASSALLLPTACSQSKSPQHDSDTSFAHGIASGDPDQSSVVIWTRISTPKDSISVDWLVATDKDFVNIVRQGTSTTDDKRDYTVKILVGKLPAGQQYFYKFISNGSISPIGRTRTLPVGHVDKLVLAVATCANYPFGYFNAYEVIANDPDIDVVVHLGDYIYEYGIDGYGGEAGQRLGRNHLPNHEIVTLEDYRQRHAQYKTDHGSLQMHAQHPLIVIWDDHESANNPWKDGAENHQADEGNWAKRRAASLQAYYEWVPVRDPIKVSDRQNYWRHYKFGDLASLITLESRHTGRSQQINYSEHLSKLHTVEQANEFFETVVAAPEREMLSPQMNDFLKSELKESVQSNRRWRIIGNQSVIAKSTSPSMDEPFFDDLKEILSADATSLLDKLTLLGKLGLPADLDTWDGYPAARERFYTLAKNTGAQDLLVISGDSHSYWQNSLFDESDQSVGLELGATGISSPRSVRKLGEKGIKRYDQLNAEHNKEIDWSDGRHQGFIRLNIDHKSIHADFITVSNIETTQYTTQTVHSVDIINQQGTLHYVGDES